MASEWLVLAELAGKPVVKEVIQVIRGKVRNSIRSTIEIEKGDCFIPTGTDWCPIIIGVKVISKTPASLRIIGIRYVVSNDGNPVQAGYWDVPSPTASSGLHMDTIRIASKQNKEIKIAINPVMLGKWPINNAGWSVSGMLRIDSAYGEIPKPFELNNLTIESKQRWSECESLFKQRFGGVSHATS
jgi:hypothetical protein